METIVLFFAVNAVPFIVTGIVLIFVLALSESATGSYVPEDSRQAPQAAFGSHRGAWQHDAELAHLPVQSTTANSVFD